MASLVDLHSFLSSFRNKIKVVYDIGASDGRSSDAINFTLTNNPTFYLFDADDKYASQQHNYAFEYHTAVFSDVEKEIEFYSNGTSGDSYYKEFTGVYDNITPTKRLTKTLDGYMKEKNLPLPDLIKIDTQGSELDILRGGIDCLKNAKVVILECPVIEYNLGAPTFDQYISFMKDHDFLPNSLTELHWLTNNTISYNYLVQMDIAFINTKKA